MAALTMERGEPEVSRFIDSFKLSQDMESRRAKFGGDTSLPLNSDGYEDKQRSLRDERHKDWLIQQEKDVDQPATIVKHPHLTHVPYGPQSAADYDGEIQKMTDRYHNKYNEVILNAQNERKDPVYYRVGTPETGFPGLGEYSKLRQEHNLVRQKEYNDMLRKQRQMEQEKLMARRRSPPRPAQRQEPQMDYNRVREQASAEDKRAYQDYMGKFQSASPMPQKPPLDYEENRKILNEERKREYNEMMEQKAKEERYCAMRGRPVTPAGGLDIGGYDRQVKETAQAKKKEYKEMLDQKYEQLKVRAMDRYADISPMYVPHQEQDRPLVGSPRDINFYMQEKESKDKFRRDLKSKPKRNFSPSDQNVVAEQPSSRQDANFIAYVEVEKDKLKNKRKYAEELLQQQMEHKYLIAHQGPEIAILDRSAQQSQYLANKPPPGPGHSRGRDEPSRQTPAFWNDGREAQGPRSFDSGVARSNRSSANVPMAFKTESQTQPLPEQPQYWKQCSNKQYVSGGERVTHELQERSTSPVNQPPRSPDKPANPEWLTEPMNDERFYDCCPPLAYKTESQTRPIPERPRYGQPPFTGENRNQIEAEGERLNRDILERRSSPANQPPRSPMKPANPEWLKVPMNDDERPAELGTPLAFKTNSYSHQPPPAPERTPVSREVQLYEKYDRGVEGLFERPAQSSDRPRSRRSTDSARKYSPTKQEIVALPVLSPRRTKNTLYEDSEEVCSKRREASKERQKEYNDFLKDKAETQRHNDEVRQQHHDMKPAEVVKNAFYSSDNYERFHKENQRIQCEEYRDFLSKGFQPPPGRVGLPLGQYKYEPKRLIMEAERNEEWNVLSKEPCEHSMNAEGLPIGQYRYEPKRLAMEAERNKDYNALLEKARTRRQSSRGIDDGPQGLNIDVNYQHRKKSWLENQRNKEYNAHLKKGEANQRDEQVRHMPASTTYGTSFKRPSPSPHMSYHQPPPSPLPRIRDGKPKTEFKDPFDFHDERTPAESHPQMQNGYPERNNPPVNVYQEQRNFPTNVSEPGGYRPRIPDYENANPGSFHQQMTAAFPKSNPAQPESLPATPSKLSLPVGQYDEMRPFIVKQRNKEYNSIKSQIGREHIKPPKTPEITATSIPVGQYDQLTPVFEKTRNEEYQQYLKRLPPLKKMDMTPNATQVTSIGQYDLARPQFESERNKEYNELIVMGKIGKRSLRQKAPTPPDQQGLPIGQQHYEPMHKAMEHQRNQEYNDFLKQKYGGSMSMRSSRSEPGRNETNAPKSSFYYGNEKEHEEKKKMLEDERKNEYNQFMKELDPPRSKSIDIPSDVDSGLPIGQQHHEVWRTFLRGQRNKEYNQLTDVKAGTEVRNRDWKFDDKGTLELRGDDAVQTKQRELRVERQKEYNTFMSQIKTPPKLTWPEPEGHGVMLNMNGEYDNVRQMYDAERKKDYIDIMQRRREMGMDLTPPTAPSEPLRARYEYYNPMINALGRYEDFRRKLTEDRKRDFKTFMEQVKTDTNRKDQISTAPNFAREETPLIQSMGKYELETRQKMRRERKKEFEDYVHEQQKRWTPRITVKENLMPHVASAETPLVNYLGQYDKEKIKFRLERNKDLRAFEEKKKQELRNPYDNYVFPTVAVAEKPIVDYMGTGLDQRKRDLRDERKQDYEDYKMQRKVTNPDRRHEFVDTANGPYGGLFLGLGQHDNRSDVLNRERHQEYNESQNQKYAGKERPSGRPNWAKDSIPNNTDRGRSPMRNQPPADQYQQMLDEKRREEAGRRRYDDPEYQGRLAQRGEKGERYGFGNEQRLM